MKNEEIIIAFLNNCSAKTKNLKSDGITLYSYNTAIATHFPIGVIFNKTKYSVTTSRIQNKLKSALQSKNLNTINVYCDLNVNRNDLIRASNSIIGKTYGNS